MKQFVITKFYSFIGTKTIILETKMKNKLTGTLLKKIKRTNEKVYILYGLKAHLSLKLILVNDNKGM